MKKTGLAGIFRLRDFFWDVRRRLDGDSFEKSRSDDFCGCVFLKDWNISLEEFVDGLNRTEFEGVLPLRDCLLQYEEDGQICSFHWLFDKEIQLHVRLFRDERGDLSRAKESVVIHGHVEMRPDSNPLAHILGINFLPACPHVHRLVKSVLINRTVDI